MQATLQRAVRLQLVVSLSLYGSSGSFCDAGVCLCLFLLLNVVDLAIYAELGLVVDITKQMSYGKEADIVNC